MSIHFRRRRCCCACRLGVPALISCLLASLSSCQAAPRGRDSRGRRRHCKCCCARQGRRRKLGQARVDEGYHRLHGRGGGARAQHTWEKLLQHRLPRPRAVQGSAESARAPPRHLSLCRIVRKGERSFDGHTGELFVGLWHSLQRDVLC